MDLLPVAVGAGWASGLSAYGTVLVLGLVGRLGIAPVPEVLTRTDVLVIAGVLFAVEFVVDKIPFLDSAWDSAHTVVRPVIAGGIASAFAVDVGAFTEALAVTGTGAVALASHAVKAGVRLAVNTSPEPLSNILVSTIEDLAMAGVSYLVATHPWVAFGIAALLLTGGILLVLAIRRRIRAFVERWRARRGRAPDAEP